MSINALWNLSKQRKDRLLPERKRFSPWKELRFNQYYNIMKETAVIVCHRQPMNALEYESLKFELSKMEWRCSMVKSGIMNAVLEELKLKMFITGPSIILYGDLDNFDKLNLPKNIMPMSVKIHDQCLDFKSIRKAIDIKYAQSHLVGVLEKPAQQLLQSLQNPSSRLVFGLNSVAKQ